MYLHRVETVVVGSLVSKEGTDSYCRNLTVLVRTLSTAHQSALQTYNTLLSSTLPCASMHEAMMTSALTLVESPLVLRQVLPRRGTAVAGSRGYSAQPSRGTSWTALDVVMLVGSPTGLMVIVQ